MTARRRGCSWGLRAAPTAAALGLWLAAISAGAGAHAPPQQPPVDPGVIPLQMLSNRADLVSGGEALLWIQLSEDMDPRQLRVDVNGRDQTQAFGLRPNGRFEGLVTGLEFGPNLVRVRAGVEAGGKITITNGPLTGPLFAGPQVQPWICTTATHGLGPPADPESCHAPTRYIWRYKSSTSGEFLPYDPDKPPPDVADTTTDQGDTVPYIVRIERGTIGRGIYDIAVLFDPKQPWDTPWEPQRGWNRKLLWLFGDGAATSHVQASPPDVLHDEALSRGYMVASSGLNVHGASVDDVVSSEALMMIGERIFERYGDIRYTIGRGCGGGAILQLLAAANYPLLLNGLILECAAPDLWTPLTEVGDCGLLRRYQTQVAPADWQDEADRAAVAGHRSARRCRELAERRLPTYFDPTEGQGCGGFPWTYDPESNPGGERCLVQDYQQAVFGQREEDGFAPRPYDNSGLQYGLKALAAGMISKQQFLDLNENIGCWNLDGRWQSGRCAASPKAFDLAYRSGRVLYAGQLGKLPMIDLRPVPDAGEHGLFRSLQLRARLDEVLGYHVHQPIWAYPDGEGTPAAVAARALSVIDEWLAAIEADTRQLTQEAKVLFNQPDAAEDSCFPDAMHRVEDDSLCGATGSELDRDPRAAAGAPLTGDVLKCQREPPDRDDYAAMGIEFTDAEWQRLGRIFADGICDWSQAGVGQRRPVGSYLSYAGGPGGRALGQPPGTRELDPDELIQQPPFKNLGGPLGPCVLVVATLCGLRRRVHLPAARPVMELTRPEAASRPNGRRPGAAGQ